MLREAQTEDGAVQGRAGGGVRARRHPGGEDGACPDGGGSSVAAGAARVARCTAGAGPARRIRVATGGAVLPVGGRAGASLGGAVVRRHGPGLAAPTPAGGAAFRPADARRVRAAGC